MSPAAAVEFQSSVTNTNPNLTSFSSTDDLSQTRPSGTAPSSSLGNAGELDFGVGAGKGNAFVSRMGTVRARPRLVKVRKQLGRSRNEAAETASGFNPFRLKVEDSGPVNSCSSTVSLQNNGVLENLNSAVSDEASVNKFSFENNESVAFVFGAIRSDQVVENEVESVSNDVCKRMERVSEAEAEKLDKKGFVFGADLKNVGGELNLERRKTSEGTVKMGSYDERKVKLENEAECQNDSTLKFQFGGDGNDLFLNLSLEKGDFSENLESGSGSTSKSERSECNRNVADSGLGFVFDASCFNSASNLISSESASSQNNGEKASNDHGKMNVENAAESQGVKATEIRFECNGRRWNEDYDQGVFVFGSGTKNSLGSNDCMSPKCPNGIKLNGKNFGNEDKILRTENNNLDFDVDNESKFVSETSGNVSSASLKDPVFKLPNEMKKLNINDYENDDGAYKKYDSNKNFCTHAADATFVFTSGVKPCSSSGESSDPTQKEKSGATAAVERRPGENSQTGDSDHIVSENSCNIDNASVGTSNSKPSTFQEGLGKGTDSGLFSSCKAKSDPWTNLAAAPASLSSVSLDSQQIEYGSESPSTVGVQKTDENSPHGLYFTEFITPNWDLSSFKANLYPKQNKKPEVSAKSRSLQDKRSKKTRAKLKKPCFLKQGLKEVHVPEQSSSQEHSRSPECYSPMDFSPYMETSVGDQHSKEASVTSNESFCADNICAPSTLHSSVTTNPNDEKLATAERLDFNIGDEKCREPNEDIFGYHHGSSHDVDYPPKEFVFGSETAYSRFNQEQAYNSGGTTSVDHADGLNTEIPSGVEDHKHFTFSASSTAEGTLTLRRRQLRKISKKKAGKHSFIIFPCPNVKFSSFSVHGQQEDNYTSKSKVENKSEAAEQVKQGFTSSVDSSQEACEMWRLRGNQAYKDGCLSQAEEFYTQGITSVPLSETAGCCIKPLVLCYSNRAAARISLGRMREALEDCVMATAMDHNFLKVYVRAAKCHLVLGEVENAVQNYNKLLESGTGICLDRRITIEAAEGLQKAQKVAKCTNHSAKLLEQKTSEAASEALEIITEALFISSCSEKLLEMKAEALYMLRKYQDAIQLCELTLHRAEKNFSSVGNDNCSLAMLWRWRLISKSYFCMGKLEAALDLLQKLEQVRCVMDKHGNEILESSTTLAATIRELLHRKNAGNEAVRSGKYTEAVEHYTIALSSNIESRPFAAICFCNRAAAFQALGQIPDAIADCSLAMALDGSYTKAVSRRAVLHEMIRDYAQAASDLQRLVSILENRADEKTKRSGSPSKSNGSKEIRQARRQLSLMEGEAKNGVPLDFYLILGVKASDAASDIKKAYRKAALRHHPDKAGQFLARTESGDEGRLWKEIAQEVHKDADRLFKMIGEAYAVLSETDKRSEYDLEEEIRKASKESYQSSPYGRPSYANSYSSRRSANRQSRQENWKTYGNSYSRW